jgi:ubiquinone/menaquinone biosynthesis C-methylase UbiE
MKNNHNGEILMNKIFDPKKKQTLDNPERREILPPENILQKAGLKTGDVAGDIGCGIGYFTLPMAKIVGSLGKVYAFDISIEMLETLRNRIEAENLQNVIILHSEQYSIPLPSETLDFALLSNVLHEVDDYSRFLNEIKRTLKPAGKLTIIDWLDKDTGSGPPLHERLSEKFIRDLLSNTNFEIEHYETIADKFHLFICMRK